MEMHRAALFVAAFWIGTAQAQPVKVPRDSRTATEAEAFRGEADAQYRKILSRLSAKGMLDDDAITLGRARHVAAGLIAAAAGLRAETATWPWEIHVTSDRSTGAFCLAGGKILVGSAFVARLGLSDDELAMLLAHEMAHAIAGHRREVTRFGIDSDPAQEIREAEIALLQESEADRIGMELAWRAGRRPSSLAGFFDKLAADEGAGTFNSTHPPAQSRAAAARALAAKFESMPPRE
jgi:predicted Zn-dependent protease